MKGCVGVHYTPTEVATQVVAGTNYKYHCRAEVPGPSGSKFTATVEIFQPLHGQPTITSITRTSDLDSSGGGWSPFGPLTAESREVFERATHGWLGVSYKPLEVSTQVVAGMNYRFRCDATVVVPDARTRKAQIEIHQPLTGQPFITQIDSP